MGSEIMIFRKESSLWNSSREECLWRRSGTRNSMKSLILEGETVGPYHGGWGLQPPAPDHIYICLRRPPLGGHQAAKSMNIDSKSQVLKSFSVSCICILQVRLFPAPCRCCQLSASMFLCCYRAHRSTFRPRLTVLSQPRKLSYFRPTPKTPKNQIK
jgi:hypothetical protein